MRLIVLAACCLVAAGCIEVVGGDDVVCTQELRYGIVVEVRNSVTDDPVLGARGAVREGAFVDSLRWFQGTGYAASERAGVYTVDVERSGFAPWSVGNVVVTRDGTRCPHVRTVHLVARLQPM